jgi:tetratricopeptide (TPR) repeat protein
LKYFIGIFFLWATNFVHAQEVNKLIAEGNDFYKKNDLLNAMRLYEQAMRIDGKNTTAQYNMANTLHRQGRFADAQKMYAAVIENTDDKNFSAKLYYNKGLAEIRQHLAEEAVESFKQALRIDGDDRATRENLQLALKELQDKQKSQKQNRPPPPPKDRNQMNKQQTDKTLDKLREEEKRLQQQIQQQKIKQKQTDKDW